MTLLFKVNVKKCKYYAINYVSCESFFSQNIMIPNESIFTCLIFCLKILVFIQK